MKGPQGLRVPGASWGRGLSLSRPPSRLHSTGSTPWGSGPGSLHDLPRDSCGGPGATPGRTGQSLGLVVLGGKDPGRIRLWCSWMPAVYRRRKGHDWLYTRRPSCLSWDLLGCGVSVRLPMGRRTRSVHTETRGTGGRTLSRHGPRELRSRL